MYLTVCPPCGPGSILSRGGVFQGIFSWLITLCQPVLSQRGRKLLNLPPTTPHNLRTMRRKAEVQPWTKVEKNAYPNMSAQSWWWLYLAGQERLIHRGFAGFSGVCHRIYHHHFYIILTPMTSCHEHNYHSSSPNGDMEVHNRRSREGQPNGTYVDSYRKKRLDCNQPKLLIQLKTTGINHRLPHWGWISHVCHLFILRAL